MTEGASRTVVERVGAALLLVGALLGAVGAGAWVLDILPTIPPWMLRIAVYKLLLATGAGMMIAGAVLRRQMRESARKPGLTGGEEVPRRALAERPHDLDRKRPAPEAYIKDRDD